MPLTTGTRLGPYEIQSQLGAGGMGEVYRATDTRLDRTVAIKVLPAHVADDPDLRQRFEREAKTISSLNHPHICTLYDIGEQDGTDFLVMEYLEGDTLAQRLEQGALPLDQALQVAIEIADALDKAHRQGIVHRDLKPGNIMLTEQDHVKVMDFGLAKEVPSAAGPGAEAETIGALTEPDIQMGTPAYMAPEQLLGGKADERSDIFAFGIVLYELLASVHPFKRASHSGTVAAILRDPPAPIARYVKDVPETARVTLDRLLVKEPDDRYQSFRDVRTDLGQLREDASRVTLVPQSAPTAVTSGTGRTPYVGHESERAEARRVLDQAVAGQGGILLLGGEPGVGKTRFAEEVLLEARQRGCLALIGRCYEMEGTPPFIPWVEIVERSARIVPQAAFREALGDAAPEVAKIVPELQRMFPDMPPPIELPPEQQRRYLFNGFLDFVKRGTRVTPQVLLLDDLHWADDSTLLLLQHVVQHISEIPLLIVGTYRDVDLEVARPFAKMLEAFTRQRLAHKVPLRRLPETGVEDMLQALSGQTPPAHLVTAIYAETEGNPFFVEEVFHHLSEEGRLLDANDRWRTDLKVDDLAVPEGIRLVIGRRVERLGPDARRVLSTAAVVGRSFDMPLLEALGDAEGEQLLTALEEAAAAKLILAMASGREERWEFAHGLIRQTLEDSLSFPRRQRAHLRVAQALEAIHAEAVERYASDIAQHLFRAGAAADNQTTIRFLTLAGDQALRTAAFAEAIARFDEALSILDTDDSLPMADLLFKKGQALRSTGRADEAVEVWREALTLYESLGHLEGIVQAVWHASKTLLWRGGTEEGTALIERGLKALGDQHDAGRCRLLGWLSAARAVAGAECSSVAAQLAEAEALAVALDDKALILDTLYARQVNHYTYMQISEVVDVSRRVAVQAREQGELDLVCHAYFHRNWLAG